MKKITLLFAALFACVLTATCQPEPAAGFNLDFERVTDGMPDGWAYFGGDGYMIGVDEHDPHGGRYSAFIELEPDADTDFKAWGFTLPGAYSGRRITLAGYMRTENVSDGYAGLWMRIDPEVAFDNMSGRGVTGTTEWQRFEITLPLNPSQMTQTVIGGLLLGRGKMWIDDLSVTVDDKDIRNLKPIQPKTYPAQEDHAFDDGSGVERATLEHADAQLLKEVGLIWGFLKYYHPAVAEGKYNWDYELFRILPKVLAANTRAERDVVLTRWIESLGDVELQATAQKVKGEVKLQPDLEWITASGFSADLECALMGVKNARRGDEHYYIKIVPYVGNPEFKKENSYSTMKYPDAGYRLLSLYRYWNMIQYYYPNIHLIGEDWKGVLEEFVPRFVGAGDETEYLLAALEIIARIHDTHANLWVQSPALETYKGRNTAVPVLQFVEEQAVVTGFLHRALGEKTGLQVGDVIGEVDGKSMTMIVKERLTRTPASNYPTQLRDIAKGLLRTNDTTLHITYLRDGEWFNTRLTAYREGQINWQADTIPAFKLLPDNIAYLYPASLDKGEIEQLWSQIQDTRGLVVDLRCYPSDFIVFSLGSHLVAESTPFVTFSMGNIRTPGLFTTPVTLDLMPRTFQHRYCGKVVILVNEQTQSQAEYTAMALRTAPDAVVVGSTTAGADGNVSVIMLPGGVRTMISGIGILYPDGRETQRVGIVPDIELRPTIRGIAAGRDEVLEKAIELIK